MAARYVIEAQAGGAALGRMIWRDDFQPRAVGKHLDDDRAHIPMSVERPEAFEHQFVDLFLIWSPLDGCAA